MTTEQPLALKLADGLTDMWGGYEFPGEDFEQQAAEELRRLHASLEREKASRQAAQIENEDLKARIARSGVEQQRAVLAEREACADVADYLPVPESCAGIERSLWDVACTQCAAAIRARGAAPQQPEGEPT